MIQMAIGQKDINVTPLQMARFYAALANGASSSPYLVQAAERPAAEGEPAVPVLTFLAAPPKEIGVDPTALSVVRDGLYEATHDANGTSSGVFGSFPVPVAGKTGTAEKVVNLPDIPSATSRIRPGGVAGARSTGTSTSTPAAGSGRRSSSAP